MPEGNFNLDAAIGAGDGKALAQVARTRRELDLLERRMRRSGSAATEAAARQGRLATALRRSDDASRRAAGSFRALHAAISAGAFAHLGRSIIGAAASFEQLRLRLQAFEGSAAAAATRFDELLDYAARTPFAIADVANAWLRLQATGFAPGLGALEALGDIAAASGRGLGELADAVAAVAQGETGPIEGFGFDIRKQGEEIAIAFGDTARTVENSRTAILAAFAEIGEAEFGGATERQADSLAAALSALDDVASQTADRIGRGGLSAGIADLARDLSATSQEWSATQETIGQVSGAVARHADMLALAVGGWLALRLQVGLVRRVQVAAAGATARTTRRLGMLAIRGRLASAALHGLTRALRVVGGPVGLALLAAEGVAIFAAKMSGAKEESEELRGALGALEEKFAAFPATLKLHKDLQQATERLAAAERAEADARAAAERYGGRRKRQANEALARAIGEREAAQDARSRALAAFDDPAAAPSRGSPKPRVDDAQTARAEEIARRATDRAMRLRLEGLALLDYEEARALDAIEQLEFASVEAREKAKAATRAEFRAKRERFDREANERRTADEKRAADETAAADERLAAARRDAFDSLRVAELDFASPAERARAETERWRAETVAAFEAAGVAVEDYGARLDAVYGLRRAADAAAEREAAQEAADKRAAAEEAAQQALERADPLAGAEAALERLGSAAEDAGDRVGRAIKTGFRSAEDALVRFATAGRLEFASLTDSILADLARIAVRRAITQPLAAALGSALGSLDFSGGGGAAVPAAAEAGNVFHAVYHAGGAAGAPGGVERIVPPAVFTGAPRLHRGGVAGLRADEVPAILQRGETVLPRGAPAAAPTEVRVEVTNRGTPQRVTQADGRFDGQRLVVSLVAEDIAGGGPVAGAIGRAFAIAPRTG